MAIAEFIKNNPPEDLLQETERINQASLFVEEAEELLIPYIKAVHSSNGTYAIPGHITTKPVTYMFGLDRVNASVEGNLQSIGETHQTAFSEVTLTAKLGSKKKTICIKTNVETGEIIKDTLPSFSDLNLGIRLLARMEALYI